jgi:hypothetical protein
VSKFEGNPFINKHETWQCHETRFLIITIVDKYVVVEIQIQATNNVTMSNVNHE